MNMISTLKEKKEGIKDTYDLCNSIKGEIESRKQILQRK